MNSKYKMLADHLELKILRGDLPVGSYLPGERTLCQQFGYSRVTVRNGLDLLIVKGLVTPVVGRGYRVLGEEGQAAATTTHIIGGVFPNLDGRLMDHPVLENGSVMVLDGLNDALRNADFNLAFDSSAGSIANEKECIQRLVRRKVDGIAIMPVYSSSEEFISREDDVGNYSYLWEMYNNGLPIVLMNRYLNGIGLPGVYNDDIAGGAMQAKYMLQRGMKSVIYFDDTCDRVSHLRFLGYCRAMREAGLSPCLVTPCNFRQDISWYCPSFDHEEEIRQLMPRISQDTGIICYGYVACALGHLFPDHRCGEHRVEWICYDMSAETLGQGCCPFPYVERPMREIGRRAGEKLLRLIEGDLAAGDVEYLPPQIITPPTTA